MLSELTCPVSGDKVDENNVRTIAIIISLIILTALLLDSYILFFLAAIDFAPRSFTSGKYSFIRLTALSISSILRLNKKPIDAAPKKFAAGLGTAFSLISGLSLLYGNYFVTYLAGYTLLACALLEGLASICIGCHVYTIIQRIVNRFKSDSARSLPI